MSSETLLAKRNVSNSLIWPFCTKVFDMNFACLIKPLYGLLYGIHTMDRMDQIMKTI